MIHCSNSNLKRAYNYSNKDITTQLSEYKHLASDLYAWYDFLKSDRHLGIFLSFKALQR